MLKCREAEKLISSRIDRELSSTDELDRHLESCGACRDLSRREEERSGALRAALRVPRSDLDALAECVLARADAEPGPRALFRQRFKGAVAAVTAFAASLALVFWIVSAFREPTPSGGGDGGVIVVRSSSVDASEVPESSGAGSEPVRVRTETDKTFLMDVPASGRKSPSELILELEHIDRRLMRPVSNSWR